MSDDSLASQRDALRQRLQAQRAVIAQELGDYPGAPGHFPRSLTVRLLTRWPGLSLQLLMRVATMLRSR
jgi:hypothetical protein